MSTPPSSPLPTLDLSTASEDEIDEAVAEHVMGWTFHLLYPPDDWPKDMDQSPVKSWMDASNQPMRGVPDSVTDASLVVSLLSPWDWDSHCRANRYGTGLIYTINLRSRGENAPPVISMGCGPTFNRAAIAALLEASGKVRVIHSVFRP